MCFIHTFKKKLYNTMYGVIEEYTSTKKKCYYLEIYRKHTKETKIYLSGSVVYVLHMVTNE